jgi:hypothetical protein
MKRSKNIIKYKYARDSFGRMVDIETIDREQRGQYSCISCGHDLVSVIGDIRQCHFRHKVVSTICSLETYLHQVAKQLFYDIYSSCLFERKDAFQIVLEHPRLCSYCMDKGPCALHPQSYNYFLTSFFSKIYMEKPDGSFVPDLLLLNESGDKLYIEIVVTHSVSHDKISSGTKLIEIRIETEDDLSLIRSCMLSHDPRVSFFNFDPKPINGDFHTECTQDMALFVLNPNGTAVPKEMKWHEYEHTNKDQWLFHEIVGSRSSPDRFKTQLEAAYIDGYDVRNCFLCRYHAKPTRYQRGESEKSIFCKLHRCLHFSNYAAKCSCYRVDRKVFHFLK